MTQLTTLSSATTMTSREIADLAGKRHDNVLRDIDNLLKTLSSELSAGFSEAYEGDPANGYRYFVLDRDSTYCLMAGYDPNARMRIIKRWQALESGAAIPAYQLEMQTPPAPRKPALDAPQVQALKLTRTAMQAARAFGLKGNQAALSADRAVRTITGHSVLQLLGQTHLAADPRGRTYTPTEIGKLLDPPLSATKTNHLLEKQGLQVHDIKGEWVPTDAAQSLCEWLDTNKRHSDGTAIKQLKWFGGIVATLAAVNAA